MTGFGDRAGMSAIRSGVFCGAIGLISVCWGESFIAQNLRDPNTGKIVVCIGHVGRGGPSPDEIDTMNACVSWYLSQGYVKI